MGREHARRQRRQHAGTGIRRQRRHAVGAWLATHLGIDDGLLALKHAGDGLRPGLGSILAAVSIAALFATVGMNAYSGMLTFVTTADSLRPIKPTRTLRVVVILALMVTWIAIAVGFGKPIDASPK